MGKRIITFILFFAIVLSLIVVPSMAVDSIAPYVVVPTSSSYYPDISVDGVSLFVYSAISQPFKVMVAGASDERIVYGGLVRASDTSVYPIFISPNNGYIGTVRYWYPNFSNELKFTDGVDSATGISYRLSREAWAYSSTDVPVYESPSEFISAAINYVPSEPEPDYVYVSACYGDLPLRVDNLGPQYLHDVLDGSYNLYDGVYTPLREVDWTDDFVGVFLPHWSVTAGPSGGIARYLVYKGHPFSASDYSTLDISGDYTFYFSMGVDYADLIRPDNSQNLYPSRAWLSVNGEPIGYGVNGTNGVFHFDNVHLDLTHLGDVYSVGIMVQFDSDISAYWASKVSYGFFASDGLNVVGSSVPVVYPEPTPRPSEPTEIVYYQPITPEDTTTDLLPNIPDDIMNDDGSKDRSVWDLIRALVKASWSLTTGIVGNAFDGVSGIVAGVGSIGNFFGYMSPDSSDGAFGIVNYEGDNIWG